MHCIDWPVSPVRIASRVASCARTVCSKRLATQALPSQAPEGDSRVEEGRALAFCVNCSTHGG